ncbi:MAG: PP2C family protein-serine/threonine phosphatase [Planctomycetota bacterium]
MADAATESSDMQAERGVFRAEYERELGQWLRRRLGWLCIAHAAFLIVTSVALLAGSLALDRADDRESLSPDAATTAAPGTAEAPPDAKPATLPTLPSAPIGRMVDRWWESAVSPSSSASPQQPQAPDANGAVAEAGDAAGGAMDGADASEVVEAIEDTLLLPAWAWALLSLPSLAILAWFGLRVRPNLHTRAELLEAATRMILILGLVTFAIEATMLLLHPRAPVTPLASIWVWHLTASLFLPWSWRESLRPIAPLFAAWLLLQVALAVGGRTDWATVGLKAAFAPALFVPALLLCWARLRWHRRRFKSGFIGRRFLAMRREYLQARAVHESIFPKPLDAGWMRFDFSYRPAADIGGDFVHTWIDDDDRFHLAIIDVTGHGLASAMSVARIHGEIERLRDEHPNDGPGKLLARLNRYFHRLLARHRLYASGVLMSLDPRTGELRYASAGHPPVFLRSRGDLTELASTTFILGAVDGDAFGEDEVAVQLEEGDTLLLFTDGAYDARSPRGERFGLDRLRELMKRPSAPPKWNAFILRLVETFEAGLPEDDLLLAEVNFIRRTSLSSITGDDLPVPARAYSEARR